MEVILSDLVVVRVGVVCPSRSVVDGLLVASIKQSGRERRAGILHVSDWRLRRVPAR